jgi:hypothetical protein
MRPGASRCAFDVILRSWMPYTSRTRAPDASGAAILVVDDNPADIVAIEASLTGIHASLEHGARAFRNGVWSATFSISLGSTTETKVGLRRSC